MFNFSFIAFVLLSFWSLVQVTTSENVQINCLDWPNNRQFQAKQQIFNFDGTCCNSKKVCMVPNGYKISSEYGAYKIHADPKTWNDARKTCVAEGAHLGVFTSVDEIRFIESVLPQNNVPRVWVGYHDQFQEGDWTTVLDKPLGADSGTVASWWPNQPDNFKGLQDCVVLDGKGMDDDVCSLKFPFICRFNSNDCNFL